MTSIAARHARTALFVLGLAASAAQAQAPAQSQDADELAKQLSNPIANLVSVPMQLNYDDGYDSGGSRTYLNVQPVIPVSISDDWNMISRTIVPIAYQDDLVPGTGSQFGFGDTTQSLWFSRKAPSASGWIVGVGPAFLIPTASDDLLGAGKWAAGPTMVALKQTHSGWTVGMLANHLWSFAGDSDRNDLSNTFVQPFVSKGLGQGRTLGLNIESSYDWKGKQWNVPMNLSYSKVSKIGTQMISYQFGVRGYLDAPDGGPDWGLRFTLTLLYPKH